MSESSVIDGQHPQQPQSSETSEPTDVVPGSEAHGTDGNGPEPQGSDDLPRRRRFDHRWPVLALTVFTLVFYWRITSHLGTDLWPSDMEDGASFTWNLWYLPHQLLSGHNPFSSNDIFYPVGAPLGFHTYIPLIAMLSWPIAQIFGMTATFSVVTLAGPVLSGIGTYYLAHHLTRSRWASLFAGVAFIVLPDRVFRMGGHVNLNHTEILPFVLLALFKFYERPTRRRAAALGALMGVSLLIESIFTAFLIIAVLVIGLIRWRDTFSKAYLVAWVQAVVAAAVVASPVAIPMFHDLGAGELDPLPGWGAADSTSADVLSYVVPSGLHPLWGDRFMGIFSDATAGERFTFVGWSLLVLAAVGAALWKGRHKAAIWTMTAVFFVLSLGPFLHIDGHQGSRFEYLGARFDIPLPYFLLHFVPLFNGVRIPARFHFMVALLLAVSAACGLAALLRRIEAGKWAKAAPVVAVLAIAVLTVECLPGDAPRLNKATIPTPYTAIANDPGHRAVLELPLQWRDGFGRTGDDKANRDDTVFMYYAIKHGKPLAGGMTARYPDEREAELRKIPVYDQILSLQDSDPPMKTTFTVADLQQLGIGYIVAHGDRRVPVAEAYVRSLNLPVLAYDGSVTVWRVPPR